MTHSSTAIWLSSAAFAVFVVAVAAAPAPGIAKQAGAQAVAPTAPVAGTRIAQAEAQPPAAEGEAPTDEEGEPLVDPNSIAALKEMGADLVALQQFAVTADVTVEQVMDNGQKVEFGGTSHYRVRRPDRMRVDMVTDTGSRTFYYDGKNLTVFAPKRGFYATEVAKPTIKETIIWAEDTYGLEVPLADLFDWGTPDAPVDEIEEGFLVGHALVDGTDTQHWAFRGEDVDWEIWIATGEDRLPRKLAITDLTDEAMPRYEAVISWSTAETFGDDVFAFTPPPDARKIVFAPLSEMAKSQN